MNPGNGRCDGDFNNEESLFDGGDCCLPIGEAGYCFDCNNCACHETGKTHCQDSQLGKYVYHELFLN